ncbi:MAG: serine hydrolase [Balneolaceae bacterium]
MFKKLLLPLVLILAAPNSILNSDIEEKLQQIDSEFSGNLGVYIKYLGDESTINYNTERNWYLASTIKIPLGIAILQKVEEGELSLDDKIMLEEYHLVDGSGDLLWHEPGTSFTIRELLERMIKDSDSTATDMLIALLGEDEFNEQIRNSIVSEGFEPFTTILQVRYDAYGELHENAANLTNMDIIKLKGVTPMSNRLEALLQVIAVDKNDIKIKTIPDAFEEYYKSNLNSGRLQTMGLVLEQFAEGEYLNEEHTKILLDIMKSVTTGDNRIKAGFPGDTEFAHKTGTQIGRACNVGIVYPEQEDPLIVAACAEKYQSLKEAESAFEKIGRMLAESW